MEQTTQMRIAGQHGSASQRKPYDQCDSQAHNDQRKGDTDTFRHLGCNGTSTNHGCSEIAVQQIKVKTGTTGQQLVDALKKEGVVNGISAAKSAALPSPPPQSAPTRW